MLSLKARISSLVFAAVAATVPASLQATAGAALPITVKPVQAFHLEVGGKRALGYFLSNDGTCDLTILLSDLAYQDDGIFPAASRVGFKVEAGKSAQVDTVDGSAIAFRCAAAADRMTLDVYARLAYSPTLKR